MMDHNCLPAFESRWCRLTGTPFEFQKVRWSSKSDKQLSKLSNCNYITNWWLSKVLNQKIQIIWQCILGEETDVILTRITNQRHNFQKQNFATLLDNRYHQSQHQIPPWWMHYTCRHSSHSPSGDWPLFPLFHTLQSILNILRHTIGSPLFSKLEYHPPPLLIQRTANHGNAIFIGVMNELLDFNDFSIPFFLLYFVPEEDCHAVAVDAIYIQCGFHLGSSCFLGGGCFYFAGVSGISKAVAVTPVNSIFWCLSFGEGDGDSDDLAWWWLWLRCQ